MKGFLKYNRIFADNGTNIGHLRVFDSRIAFFCQIVAVLTIRQERPAFFGCEWLY